MSWTATPEAPQRQAGPAWTTDATAPRREHGPGWFVLATPERLAALFGEGTLAVVVDTRYPAGTAILTGRGALSAVIAPRLTIAATFTAAAALDATAAQRRSIAANFSAGGNVTPAVNDGLWAIITGGTSFTDGLSAIVIGGAFDGLTATVTPGSTGAPIPVAAHLTGNGTLSATVIGYEMAQGTLTATVTKMATGAIAAGFSGDGALTAVVNPKVAAAAPLAGVGALSAVVAPKITTAAGFTATGALSAAGVQQYPITAGFGDIPGIVDAHFDQTAEGMLTATVTQAVIGQSVTALFTGAGVLTATPVKRASIAAALTGAGTLSATVTAGGTSGPTMLISESFSGANVTALNGTAPDYYLGGSAVSKVWSSSATIGRQGGKCYVNSTAGFKTGRLDLGVKNAYVEVLYDTLSGAAVAVVGRYVDGNNHYRAYVASDGTVTLEKAVGGTVTQLYISDTGIGGAGKRFGLWVSGTIIAVYVNDVPIFVTTDSGVPEASAGTNWGIGWFSGSTTGFLDNLKILDAPPSIPASDDFNRADNASSLGANWTNRVGVLGISGNTAYSPTNGSWVVASNNTALGADDMEASITYGPVSSGNDYAMVAIGANSSGEMVLADHASFDGNFHIYSSGDWLYNGLVDQAQGGGSITTGDVLKLKRVGNVYTLYLNGVSTGVTWTDSGNVIPRDSSHRLTAIGIYDDGSGQRRIDSFEAH